MEVFVCSLRVEAQKWHSKVKVEGVLKTPDGHGAIDFQEVRVNSVPTSEASRHFRHYFHLKKKTNLLLDGQKEPLGSVGMPC